MLLKKVLDSKENTVFLRGYESFTGFYQHWFSTINIQEYFVCPDFPT